MPDKSLRKITLRKLVKDQLRHRFGRKVRRLSVEAGTPPLLMLEGSAACNLSCAKCAHKSAPRQRGNMDPELAGSVIDQAAGMGARWVCLSMLGEPLLNPCLEEIISRARQAKLNTYMVTNGMLLTPERTETLLEAGLGGVVVSIDGWDAESWKQKQAGIDPQAVMQNLAAFQRIKQKQDPPPELASISIIDTSSVRHLKQMKRYLAPATDRCGIIPLMEFGIPGYQIEPRLVPGRSSWMSTPCRNLWDTINVGWDGKVTACCNDHGFLLHYGDATKETLQSIWNNSTMQTFRKHHLEKKLEQMPMCGACTQDFEKSLQVAVWRYRFSRM